MIKTDVNKSERIDSSDFQKHEMFSKDAPAGALTKLPASVLYAKIDVAEGTIVTSAMFSDSVTDSTNEGSRIIFIPTKDRISNELGSIADLISVSPDGFGSSVVAYEAKILFDFSQQSVDEETFSDNPGYFVEVTQDEANAIVQALSTGEVRFALVGRTR